MGNMIFKTLVYRYKTEYQEFVGRHHELGWVTSVKPIYLFNSNITKKDIPYLEEFHNYDDLELVTIELKFID